MLVSYLKIFISTFLDILSFAIVARVLLSWFPNASGNIKMFLYDITEPVLGIFKKIVPRMGMIDISPLVALLAIDLLKAIILSMLSQ